MVREGLSSKTTVVLLAMGAATTLAPALVAAQQEEPGPPLLTVGAEAYAEAEPDVAKISLGIHAVRKTPKDAADEVAGTADAVKARLTRLGVAEEAVETSELYLGELVEWDAKKRRTVRQGYQAYHWLRVTLRNEDFDRLSAVVDGAVAAGATSFSGLAFEVENDNALRARALAKAVGYAREKAEAMAQAAGTTIARVQSITEEYGWPYGADESAMLGFGAAAAEAGPGPQALPAEAFPAEFEVPGKLRIRCQVEVAFLLA